MKALPQIKLYGIQCAKFSTVKSSVEYEHLKAYSKTSECNKIFPFLLLARLINNLIFIYFISHTHIHPQTTANIYQWRIILLPEELKTRCLSTWAGVTPLITQRCTEENHYVLFSYSLQINEMWEHGEANLNNALINIHKVFVLQCNQGLEETKV